MKKLYPFLMLVILSSQFTAYSQFEYYVPKTYLNKHNSLDCILSASPDILFNTPNGTQFAGGLKFECFLSKRFSVDVDLVFSHDYFHSGPGLIGIPVFLLTFNSEGSAGSSDQSFSDFLFYAAAVVLSVEHLSYHIPVGYKTDISPYVSLLRYRYSYEHGNYEPLDVAGEQLSFAQGIEINNYIGKFVLSPYAEYNVGYQDHKIGYNIGLYCGIYLPVKK
jgi:hypothetical protein